MEEYDTICLSGGGIKGFAHIGALNYLELKNHINLSKIKKWVGTSAGAFISFLFSIGYTTTELGEILFNVKFNLLEPDIDVDMLLSQCGVDNGDKIITILKYLLKLKYNIEEITFKEHFELTKKELIITGTNYCKGIGETFDYIKYPNMSVIIAVRISSSVPILFTPVCFNNEYYIDGALTDNFPIKYCNLKTTLGIYIRNGSNNNLNHIFSLINGCIGILSDTITDIKNQKHNVNVMEIQNKQNEPISFEIDLEKKHKIIKLGQINAIHFLENINKNICHSIIDEIIDTL
jgi:predicted acylesterase/phospholipase RssA